MSNRKRTLFRLCLPAIFFGLLTVFHCVPGHAEILPTKGTFRGVYHVNRAGVGRFTFFIISKALKGQMAPWEGKYVEVEILKARQPINPGPAIVDRIGTVTRLPDPPLTLQLQTVSPGALGGKTIDVIYSLTNVGKKDTVSTRTLFAALRRLNVEPLQDLFQQLPDEALPKPIDDSVQKDIRTIDSQLGFSGCVRDSLQHLAPQVASGNTIRSEDIFVDIAKNGRGESVRRLRSHGVDIARINQIVEQLGWRVLERKTT